MWLAISIALLQASVALVMAYLGYHVSVTPLTRKEQKKKKKTYRTGFGVLALISLGLILIQTYRTEKAQSEGFDIQKGLREKNDELAHELERVRLPIRDISVSFRINIPLNHPALDDYRRRIEQCVQLMESSRTLQCGVGYHTIDTSGQFIMPNDFSIPINSELYPNLKTDPVAWGVVNQVDLILGVFKSAPNEQELAKKETVDDADLSFVAGKRLDTNENNNNGSAFIGLCYEINTKTLFLVGDNVPINPITLRTNGKITSIPDLFGATLVIRPKPLLLNFNSTPANGTPALTDASRVATEISHTAVLQELALNLSGHQFKLSGSDLGRTLRGVNGINFYLTRLVK